MKPVAAAVPPAGPAAPAIEVIHTVEGLRARLRREKSIAFVPTMGNLHAGHISLVGIAREHAGCVVASIFVNRLQFEPGGDFDRYPRTLAHDCELLAHAKCDVVFAPDEPEMYPEPQEIRVTPPAAASQLCGDFRPGHFEGVVTVVSKLFNIVRPHTAVFGKKDYQQLFVIRQLVKQLNFGIEIVGGKTVRDVDGLAKSSRNGYLTREERALAPQLHLALRRIKKAILKGARDYGELEEREKARLARFGWRVDYIALRNQSHLAPPNPADRELVVLGAAWLGKTRLIDNLEISRPLRPARPGKKKPSRPAARPGRR